MKKIFVLLLILFLLAIAVSVSPILPYFQSLGAAPDPEPTGNADTGGAASDSTGTDSAAADRTDTDSSTDTDTGETAGTGESAPEDDGEKTPSRKAILFAVILSGVTIVVALVVLIRKSDPDRN